jgi:hypothetical protein
VEQWSDGELREAVMAEAILMKTSELLVAGVDKWKTWTEGDRLEIS